MNEEIKEELDEEVVDAPELESEDESFDTEETFDEDFEDEEEQIDEDVEFDYDEEGNVIIPEDKEEEVAETKEEEPEKAEDAEESNTLDEKDAKIASLEKSIKDRDAKLRDALKSLGVNESDIDTAIEKLAAEAEDKTVEKYRQERDERIEKEEAEKLIKEHRFEEKIRADLSAINTAYPDTKKYKSVYEFPNFAKFSKYRDLGLPPDEAYIASHPQGVISSAVNSAQQQMRNLSGTKDHLRSNVPVGSKDTSITITKRQMSEYRDIFPNLSDKEIVALHKQTMKN